MLKHRINQNNVSTDKVVIDVDDINIVDVIEEEFDINRNVKIVTCSYNNVEDLSNINVIYTTNVFTLKNNINEINSSGDFSNYSDYSVNGVYDISNTNNIIERTFSFTIPYYYRLVVQSMDVVDIDEKKYLYINFLEPHFFTINKEISDENEEEIHIWYRNSVYEMNELNNYGEIEVVSRSSIRIEWNDFFVNFFMYNENDEITSFVPDIEFYRENFLFNNNDNITLYYQTYKYKLNVPLTAKSQINLLKEDTIGNYVKEAKNRSINNVTDMEKDVYHPVIINEDGSYENVFKIKFNLHFRRHIGENWTTETESFWNGVVIDDDGILDFDDKFFSYTKRDDIDNDYSQQSDLLGCLNFTTNDVRYQKNKLKKSFLRLSFYDSMIMGNQNLLAYSTIFLDSGSYFNKYIKHIEDKPYKQIVYSDDVILPLKDDDENNIYSHDLIGIRVNREPENGLVSDKPDDIEEYRLSSQVIVTDKYNSDSSSEGFYLYLWKDILPIMENEVKDTQDIYLKIEFNHAGYGRTIPFMMPYWDSEKWNGENRKIKKDASIKTFKDILNDWNEKIDTEDKTPEEIAELKKNMTTDGEYGARQFVKYSYIHFKIGYDKIKGRYIYYLDDKTYGNSVTTEKMDDNTVILNLYEAKMV